MNNDDRVAELISVEGALQSPGLHGKSKEVQAQEDHSTRYVQVNLLGATWVGGGRTNALVNVLVCGSRSPRKGKVR